MFIVDLLLFSVIFPLLLLIVGIVKLFNSALDALPFIIAAVILLFVIGLLLVSVEFIYRQLNSRYPIISRYVSLLNSIIRKTVRIFISTPLQLALIIFILGLLASPFVMIFSLTDNLWGRVAWIIGIMAVISGIFYVSKQKQ